MRIVGGAGQLGHALGEFRRAGCGIAQAVERLGKAVEVVDGLGLAGERHRRHVGVPVRRHGDDRLGPGQKLAERRQEGARRHVVQDQRRRAVRDENRWHRHRFIPWAAHGSLCAIGVQCSFNTGKGQNDAAFAHGIAGVGLPRPAVGRSRRRPDAQDGGPFRPQGARSDLDHGLHHPQPRLSGLRHAVCQGRGAAHPAADGRQVRDLARQAHLDLHPARRPGMARRPAGHRGGLRRLAQALGRARCAGPAAHGIGRRDEGGRRQDLHHRAQGAVRPRPRGAGQALLERAVHDAQAGGRDRPVQADRRLYRLRSVHLQEGRMEARREDRLRQEHQVQAARRAALHAGRRQGREGRPGRMDRHHRSPDRGQCAAAGRDRPDRGAGARSLPDAQGRQEHLAVRLERARQPDHHALQPPPPAVQQS